MTTSMIEVDQLTKRYGPLTAIEQVSFRVAAGEVVGFLGPNGAGKTTTMRIITGAIPPTSGCVKVDGDDVNEFPLEVKQRIGYLPEFPPLYPELTVTEYLRYVARIKGVPGREIHHAIDRSLERCALGQVSRRLIGNLSRGFRQRVGLAQALIHDPPVLILDEPTSGLDPKQIIEIRELIKTLAGDHTVILSTHILHEATAICQRVVIIHQGRVVAEDTPDQLSAQLRGTEQLQVVLRRPTEMLRQALSQLPGVRAVSEKERLAPQPDDGRADWIVESERGCDVREEVAQAVVRGNGGLLELTPVAMSLEEVFLQLTAEESTGDEGENRGRSVHLTGESGASVE